MPSSETLDKRAFLRFQIYIWGFLTGYALLWIAAPSMFTWSMVLAEITRIGILALVSQGIVVVATLFRWFFLQRPKFLACGLVACVLSGIIPSLLLFPVNREMSFYAGESNFSIILADYIGNTGMLIMWGAFFLAFFYHDRNSRLELERMQLLAASKEDQLSTLKSQLNPHFLFNSFNLLRALVQHEPLVARSAITHLSEMMRHSLTLTHQNTIGLASELHFVESYLALERLRFEERLRVSVVVPEDLLHHQVPSMLMYALVENAVKYGLDQSRAGVDVTCVVWREQDSLFLRVTNGGKLVDSGSSTGTGLRNIRNRLALLYGEHASVAISEKGAQVVAEASWPVTISIESNEDTDRR